MGIEVVMGFIAVLAGFGVLYTLKQQAELNQKVDDLMSVVRVLRHHMMKRMEEEK